MKHLSDWHVFDPTDRNTYPKVNAPVQVKFDNGQMEEGDVRMYFPLTKLFPAHRSGAGGTSNAKGLLGKTYESGVTC